MAKIYFEDLEVGQSYSIGPRTITETEIIDFASQYDPQMYHVDRDVAEESRFGSLIASGWHTASISMRLFVDVLPDDIAMVCALGVDELRWHKPVYGGDNIRLTTTVIDAEDWDGEKGLVKFNLVASNQHEETVMTRTDLVLIYKSND